MIPEKMLELLILGLAEGIINEGVTTWVPKNKKYNVDRMSERMKEILEEFLEPYVIESDSKE